MDNSPRDADPTRTGPALPPPSARVRLEVDILRSEPGMPDPPPVLARDDTRRVVLVVSADGDLRRYVRESLSDRVDIRVLEAATIHDARRLSEHTPANLVITDFPDVRGLGAPPAVPALLITDDSSDRVSSAADCVVVPRPFTAEGLARVVARLLG